MMTLNWSPLTLQVFLADYWQQQPVLIKGGIVDFDNPCDADELAGLASEAAIESRLIWHDGSNCRHWQAEHGPFEDYHRFGDSNWSLVVQSVNHWLPEVQAFARQFDFIPQWRFDDVMVSFAAPGGGVGPHVDNYDVFICQGSGQRHWRVGAKDTGEAVIAHEHLRHVKPFAATIDAVVEAGDILYIPPGYPHEGVSLDVSMSFSVGYKSTHATELLSGFADYLIDFDEGNFDEGNFEANPLKKGDVDDKRCREASPPVLLCDKQRAHSRYGQIDAADFARLRDFLLATLDDERRLSDFIGRYHSQSRSELDLAAIDGGSGDGGSGDGDNGGYDDWLATFKTSPLQKLYAVKMLYLEKTVGDGVFYVDGERQQLDCSPDVIRCLCDCSALSYCDIDSDGSEAETVRRWLWHSFRRGYWYIK